MERARWITMAIGLGVLLGGGAAGPSARAEDLASGEVPRTLRGGAPAKRLPSSGAAKPVAEIRPTPAPSITLDPRTPGDARGERRSAALLLREIALLKRLIGNTPRTEARRADALLRLSYAYQELMWLQKVELHRLEETRRQRCRARPQGETRPASCIARATTETRENPPS